MATEWYALTGEFWGDMNHVVPPVGILGGHFPLIPSAIAALAPFPFRDGTHTLGDICLSWELRHWLAGYVN